MRRQRPIFWIPLLCIVAVVALGLWILRQGAPVANRNVPMAEAPASPVQPPSPTTVAGRAVPIPSGHRLAGTVVGDATYAIVEGPEGSDLYRLGDQVSGLGKVTQIEADRATFQGNDGLVELLLAPAATKTTAPPTRTVPPGSPSVEPEDMPTSEPAPPRATARTLSESPL